MKKVFLVLTILFAKFSFGQSESTTIYTGIFMTATDFAANKLTYAENCDSSSEKIKTNCFFSQHYVEVLDKGNKIKLNKDSVFGYRDCEQRNFRFYENGEHSCFQIMENKSLIIYSAEVRVNSSTGKTFTLVPAYFFSKTLSSEILPLNVINLKKATSGNLKFHDSLDVEFPDNKNISVFDSEHKMYKVNYLLSQSLSN